MTFSDEDAQEIDEEEDLLEFINTVQPAPPELEDGGQPTVDDLQEINLGTESDPKLVVVSASLTKDQMMEYKNLLEEF